MFELKITAQNGQELVEKLLDLNSTLFAPKPSAAPEQPAAGGEPVQEPEAEEAPAAPKKPEPPMPVDSDVAMPTTRRSVGRPKKPETTPEEMSDIVATPLPEKVVSIEDVRRGLIRLASVAGPEECQKLLAEFGAVSASKVEDRERFVERAEEIVQATLRAKAEG